MMLLLSVILILPMVMSSNLLFVFVFASGCAGFCWVFSSLCTFTLLGLFFGNNTNFIIV